MIVYLFRVVLFFGCFNFVLKMIVDDFEEECGNEVVEFVCYDFYVDDVWSLFYW